MINCYSLLTWNNQLHYNDMQKKELVTVELKAQSKSTKRCGAYSSPTSPVISVERMAEITNIAMDERGPTI